MPELALDESLEVTKIHSASGALNRDGIISKRPFRSPHHSISSVALAGGGSVPQPGEISLSHHGVLFLDELPEFRRDALECLRQPLEDGAIRISRSKKSVTFPASFMLAAAMNPCPCGYYAHPKKVCRCNTTKVQSYISKISGPLLDRIDIHIELPSIEYKELSETKDAESSETVKARIEKARLIQKQRFSEGILCNGQMNARLIKRYCALNEGANELLKKAMNELGLSARAYNKILKVARTIADLSASQDILPEHIAEAVQYRNIDTRI